MRDNKALEHIRVLVVEDEKDTRDLLGFVLQSHGAIPVLCSNVTEALGQLKEQTPHVIVADIAMPDYNGYAFIAAIRKEDQGEISKTPVIALTAYSSSADRDTALNSGFNEYMVKPFEPGILVTTIKRLYNEHHVAA